MHRQQVAMPTLGFLVFKTLFAPPLYHCVILVVVGNGGATQVKNKQKQQRSSRCSKCGYDLWHKV